jgi:uncharacterized protein (UPF0548 family)
MTSLRKPSPGQIARFLDSQQSLDYTYAPVGATATALPEGYVVDRVRTALGRGESTFAAAKTALCHWRQLQLGWIAATPPATPIAPGATVAVVIRAAGLWWLNASRIVYVVDEADETASCFGFAYGTLPGHAESGEEQFLVEHDRATDEVWYSILAFSRPRHPLARLGRPLVRRIQQRFGRESAAAMVKAVATGADAASSAGATR